MSPEENGQLLSYAWVVGIYASLNDGNVKKINHEAIHCMMFDVEIAYM